MTDQHQLETELGTLLKYGTIICSAIILMGVVQDLLDIELGGIQLVALGIAGFILLPILRLLTMLKCYLSEKDLPMVRVVGIVLGLVMVGAIAGLLW